MENIKKAIESPTSAEAYVNRGDKFYDQGNYQAAISDYDEAIRLNSEYHAQAYNNRGFAKSKLGHLEGPISDYDTAIRINPEYALARTNRENAQKALREREEET